MGMEEIEMMNSMDKQDSPTTKLEVILGKNALDILAQSTVMVLGVGGVGSNCIEALARGGVGRLIIADHDTVSVSNINRQAVAYHSTIGQKKVDVMESLIHDINPDIVVEKIDRFIFEEDIPDLLDSYASRIDYLVDAIDTISAKLAVAAYAQKAPFKTISSMGGANKLHPECFAFADLFDTVNCPLCRIMRKEARKRGISHHRVLYSYEKPLVLQVQEGYTRRDKAHLGTASFIPPLMGQMIAGEVIKDLAQVSRDGYVSEAQCQALQASLKAGERKKRSKR